MYVICKEKIRKFKDSFQKLLSWMRIRHLNGDSKYYETLLTLESKRNIPNLRNLTENLTAEWA